MRKLEHPFFEILKQLRKKDTWSAHEVPFPKRKFYQSLKQAKPFVFDRKTTNDKLEQAGDLPLAERVESFSLPFKTSLYLLTDPHIVQAGVGDDAPLFRFQGYLLDEITPETFHLYIVGTIQLASLGKMEAPYCDHVVMDLRNIQETRHDYILLNTLTNAISVQRVGIEKHAQVTYHEETALTKFTTVKYDNIVHIADKVEYEYTKGMSENVNWEFAGWWRGHWRALYFPDHITDSFGRRVVDYERKGKNREGEYCVAGYTWVVEHTRGDAALAEIKTRLVKAES